MKKYLLIAIVAVVTAIILSSFFLSIEVKSQPKVAKSAAYIVIAWNDLGMHCSNKNFGNLCVLPPYNNQHAQIIKVGDASNSPEILTTGYHTSYSVPGNTYSVGKTDFWTYANALFGVSHANNIGLTGVGLTGNMSKNGNYFHVEGIPVTPYTDADLVNEHPYQLALVRAYDTLNNLIASTQSVIPVSNELSCVSSGCHSSETQILNLHESVSGFNPTNTPILCANCHQDNALGKPGTAGTPVFSAAIHSFHSDKTTDCYKCHPGPNTQCFRDVMFTQGMVCQDCHGDMANVATTIENGRQAWLQEPDCGNASCHGATYAAETNKLFRNSEGHGGLFCSACHGSPHAILPTNQANDNVQNIALQGYQGTLNNCSTCHGYTPSGSGPHGLFASVIEYKPTVKSETVLYDIFPNPVSSTANISFLLGDKAKVVLQIINNAGQRVRLLLEQSLNQGEYHVNIKTNDLAAGTYYYTLRVGSTQFTKKMLIVK
ncbi:MAG: T9SS type A sorting domain-containing protein [Bacteroidota bacterium]